MSWVPLGDAALVAPRPTGAPARALFSSLRRCAGVLDVVVTEDHVCVHFDPRAPPASLDEALCIDALGAEGASREIVVRVQYDGIDLLEVAALARLPVDEVVRIHAAGSYEVRMLGFAPGFAYLGGLDARLVTPRRAVPRPRVPGGSVAVAGEYTAIYPLASPGGWNLIGSTDLPMFSPENGSSLRLGDRVRFTLR